MPSDGGRLCTDGIPSCYFSICSDEGLTKTAIAQRLGVSRGIVHHWIKTGQLTRDVDAAPVRRAAPRATKLDAYKAVIDERLTTYPELSAVRLFAEMQDQHRRRNQRAHIRTTADRHPTKPYRRGLGQKSRWPRNPTRLLGHHLPIGTAGFEPTTPLKVGTPGPSPLTGMTIAESARTMIPTMLRAGSLPREALGFSGAHDIQPGISNTRQRTLLEEIRDACETHVGGPLRGELIERVTEQLRSTEEAARWSIEVAKEDPGALLFAYPPSLSSDAYGAGVYIRPVVRLEFGGRNEVRPAETYSVRPYCLEIFPDLSETPSREVSVLAAERTYWEKATLIHAEFHRPPTSNRPDRVSRHYSNLARLAHQEVGRSALERIDLLSAVAQQQRVASGARVKFVGIFARMIVAI